MNENNPLTSTLIQQIKDFVIELFNQQVNERRILPGQISVHYLEFEKMFMSQYKGDEYVNHKTIRDLLKWVYQAITVANDPTEVITAIKFISPNIEALDDRTMAAVAQCLLLSGAGVKPTINNSPDLLPYEVGFDLLSNIIRGQLAYNVTDNIWYYRKPGTPDTVEELRTGMGIRISDIVQLQETLNTLNIVYSFKKPLFVISPEISAYSPDTYYNIGDFIIYGGKTYTCQDLPGLETAEDFVPGYSYADQDIVIYEGELFTCILDGTLGALPTDEDFWRIGQSRIAPDGENGDIMWREIPGAISPKLVDIKIDPSVLAVDALGRLTVIDGTGNFLSTVDPQDFDNGNLVNNVLIIDHGKKTLNVDIIIWDNVGKKVNIVPVVVNENRVTVDLGEPITGVWRYVLVYWKNQSIGTYPDPIYALSNHTHLEYAPTSHSHDVAYAAKSHSHSEYAAANHTHSTYAPHNHNHDSVYSGVSHNHIMPSPSLDFTNKDPRVTLGILSMRRYGNVVSGYIVARCTVQDTWVRIADISIADRPDNSRYANGAPETPSVVQSARIWIQSSGNIYAVFGIMNHNFYFSITYII